MAEDKAMRDAAMVEDRAMRDAAFVLKRMNRSRCGVYPHKKTGRFEIKVRDNRSSGSESKYIFFGYHWCEEAAARIADKAIIVMSHCTGENPDPSTMKLNYRLTDYDPSYIAKLKDMPKDKMICTLKRQAEGDSRGCAKGLVPHAKDDLEHALRRRRSEAQK